LASADFNVLTWRSTRDRQLKIISEDQHDIVIAFDYDADRKDRVTLPIDVNNHNAEVRNLMLEAER
jgi:hypothetical protein